MGSYPETLINWSRNFLTWDHSDLQMPPRLIILRTGSQQKLVVTRKHFIHSFIFAFNKKYNNGIQKYIKDNICTIFQLNYYKIKYGKGKEAYIETGGL